MHNLFVFLRVCKLHSPTLTYIATQVQIQTNTHSVETHTCLTRTDPILKHIAPHLSIP